MKECVCVMKCTVMEVRYFWCCKFVFIPKIRVINSLLILRIKGGDHSET